MFFKRKKWNKRGNFPDVIEWMRIALFVGFVIVLCVIVFNKFNEQVQLTPNATISQTSKDISQSSATGYPPLWDYLFLLVLLVFVIFSVTAARLIPSRKEFIMISLIFLIFLPFAAMIVENIWYGFATQTEVNTVLNTMIFMPYIFNHLVVVVLIYTFLVAIALLTKEGGII